MLEAVGHDLRESITRYKSISLDKFGVEYNEDPKATNR
jgi:hypothetical protein